MSDERVYARVDLKAIGANLEAIADRCPGSLIMPVIKADGYGHGSEHIARFLQNDSKVWGFAVAALSEARELREAGVEKPLLILGHTFPGDYKYMVEKDIRATVFIPEMARLLSEEALRQGKKALVHVKVDTGMSRIGIKPDEDGIDFIKGLTELEGIRIEGIFTHFARADEEDEDLLHRPCVIFRDFLKEAKGICPIPLVHGANSAAISRAGSLGFDMVRAGIILYGLWPSGYMESRRDLELKPALSLHSQIVYIKEVEAGTQISYGGCYEARTKRRVATIPVGYGDGYPRGLSGKGCVLIRGQRAPILGRVCMDQLMVDISDIEGAVLGDEVVLLGSQGREEITAQELGDLSGRFNYELVCCINKRVPRIYNS